MWKISYAEVWLLIDNWLAPKTVAHCLGVGFLFVWMNCKVTIALHAVVACSMTQLLQKNRKGVRIFFPFLHFDFYWGFY